VQVNQPPCGNQCITFAVECGGEEGVDPECQKDYRKWFCPLVFLLMTISFIVGILFLILDSTCLPSPVLANVGAVSFALGFIWFALYFLFCQKCLCGWVQKLLWRVCFAVGVIITTFTKLCTTLLFPGLLLILAGIVLLIWWASICKKSFCAVVKEAIFVISILILPLLFIVLGLAGLGALLVLFGPFTFIDLILLVLVLLVLYDKTWCAH